jgi:septum formation protein
MELVLASSSRWRLAMLERAGIRCSAVAPAVDEHAIFADSPRQVAEARARAKAEEVQARLGPGPLIIGADQVVHLGGVVLGKPKDDGAHMDMLVRMRGRRHELVTAVALRGGPEDAPVRRDFEVVTLLQLRADLSDEELAAYVATGEARGCGGGYMIESLGAQLFERVEGDFNNVLGLPLFRLIGELRALGWRPDFARAAADIAGAG